MSLAAIGSLKRYHNTWQAPACLLHQRAHMHFRAIDK